MDDNEKLDEETLAKQRALQEKETDVHILYMYFDVFRNPRNLPINEVFLDHSVVTLSKDFSKQVNVNLAAQEAKGKPGKITSKVIGTIPALDKSWVPNFIITFEYQKYIVGGTEEDDSWFIENNENYSKFLNYLIKCNYHQFWCSIIFHEEVRTAILDFVMNPVPPYLIRELPDAVQSVYVTIYNQMYLVFKRLFYLNQSESEYMTEEVGAKYLIDGKLLNLQIIITADLLFRNFDPCLLFKMTDLYFKFSHQEKFIEQELEHCVLNIDLTFGSIIATVLDNGELSKMMPIELGKRPQVFDLQWINMAVDSIYNAIKCVYSLFGVHGPAIYVAIKNGLPNKLALAYESVFAELYDLLEGRCLSEKDGNLCSIIWQKMAEARICFLEVYRAFTLYLFDQLVIASSQEEKENFVELYMNILTSTMEYEVCLCDYNLKFDVEEDIDMFAKCIPLDETRINYIRTSIQNFERTEFIERNKYTIEAMFKNNPPKAKTPPKSQSTDGTSEPTEQTLDEKIEYIQGLFPHLGDGYIEKCLEALNYNRDDVVHGILDNSLPSHLLDIRLDLIRIPPEPEPEEPVLAYQGKKPSYDDAMGLLDDKSENEKIKRYILDGVAYNYRFNNSDDDFDEDEVVIAADNFKMNERYDVDESDSSESDSEETASSAAPKNAFCEDPAVIRARREAQKRGAPQNAQKNVVGKPKGQGQSDDVTRNRQKKNAKKSSRANHNRKGGAEWKRSRGMFS